MKCAAGSTGIFEEHIMHALVECGITQDFHGDIYNELFSPDSPKNIIVEPKFVGVKEVIDAIHGAGGIAVLAHPYKYNSVPGLDRYVKYGIDGIEVWCPSSSEEQQNDMLDYARTHKLLAIGGSAVSYTHLDVYKRQLRRNGSPRGNSPDSARRPGYSHF